MIPRAIMLGIVGGETALASLNVNLDVAATLNACAALVIAVTALLHARSNRARIRAMTRIEPAPPGAQPHDDA